MPLRALSLALLLAASASSGAVAQVPDASPLETLAQGHIRRAQSLARSPRGAVELIRLQALRDELPDLEPLARTYRALARDARADPFVRTTAGAFLADVERARGRTREAEQAAGELHPLRDFYVVGGFDNEGKAGCDTAYEPEKGLDLKAVYPVRGYEVGWRKLPAHSFDGLVDLAAVVRPAQNAVAYAATVVTAPRAGPIRLALGTSGGHRLWLNGALAHRSDRYNAARPDQTRLQLQLAQGPNLLLLKVCGQSAPLGFHLRFDPVEGQAVPGVSTPEALPAFPKAFRPHARLLPTLASELERQVKQSPRDGSLRGDYATTLAHTRAFDELERTAAVEAEQAAALAPADPELLLLAARLREDDVNLRRRYVEAAVAAVPNSARAQLALATHELQREHPELALPILEGLVQRFPRFGTARIHLARAYEALGEGPRAVSVTEQAFRDLPRLPAVVRDAAGLSLREGRLAEAIERWRAALALRQDDLHARRALASLLSDAARVDEATQELDRILAQDPFDNATRLARAELAAANGRFPEAQAVFAAARALSPEDPEVYEREGRALLQSDPNRKADALKAYERALALRPQNPALREALRSLTGDNASYGARHTLDMSELAREAESYRASEDAVTLGETTYVRVQSSGLSSRFHQLGVKVFTQRGVDAFRSQSVTYSPDRQEVRVLKARITKPDGSVVESFNESDRAINEPWSGMYYDARARVISFPGLAPGDVLELQYRLDDTARENLLSDYWGEVDYVQSTTPKLRYQYLVDMPENRPLYWNSEAAGAKGLEHRRDTVGGGRALYTWRAARVSKVVPEPSMPGWAEVVSTLHVSTYQSWEQVGRYYWGLIRDQLAPDDELRKTVAQLLKNVDRKNPEAVTRALYQFVVSHTRYVALEFGIHGYKPYRVDRVLARRFGDCKDKASLLYAMLKVAGVDSRLVLLRMRHLGRLDMQPASLAAFNHAVVYVPSLNLYLDGTAELHGARELPVSDRAANVLVVEPEGRSEFLTTPEATPEENLTHLSLEVALTPDGAASLSGKTVVRGANAPEHRRSYQSPATRKSTVEQGWAQTFPGATAQEVSLSNVQALDEDVTLSYRMRIPRYAEQLPRALRFNPFGAGRTYAQTFAPLSERRFDLVLPGPWVNRFSFRYALPAGFSAEL
ncbi:MAG TPA: DUF3857 domain-containing protein, partial [Myxococcaceae bacterium]|nr:DUF3857 domain-containing protein [Myxococcaceae bacterium]